MDDAQTLSPRVPIPSKSTSRAVTHQVLGPAERATEIPPGKKGLHLLFTGRRN